MNKNLKNTLRNKAIPRVKIVNHLEQGLSQHRQPFISYFDKIEGHRSYLNLGGGQVHQAQQITKTYQGSGSKGQFSKLPDLSPEIHINSRDRLQPVLTSILRKTTTGQTKTYPHHYSSFNQLTHSPSPTAIQTNNLQKQLQYMSYEEYQQLTAHGLVQPGHFSALARRNDLQKATPTNRNRRDLSLHQAIKEKQQNSAKIMPRASYKTRNQRLLTDVSTDKAEQSTIMNTKVGALSNMAIRQVLETQWMEQFKNKVMATAFTEQSEDKSEKDTKRIIIKDEINCSRKNRGQKRQSKLSQRQKQIRKLPVGKYRHIFQKIYQAEDLDLDRQKRAGRALSYAEQYSAHEEKLMHFNEVYRIRKGALKHKLDWKV